MRSQSRGNLFILSVVLVLVLYPESQRAQVGSVGTLTVLSLSCSQVKFSTPNSGHGRVDTPA